MEPEPRPLHIAITQSQLLDLQSRLALTRFPDTEAVADWDQGVPPGAGNPLRVHTDGQPTVYKQTPWAARCVT